MFFIYTKIIFMDNLLVKKVDYNYMYIATYHVYVHPR